MKRGKFKMTFNLHETNMDECSGYILPKTVVDNDQYCTWHMSHVVSIHTNVHTKETKKTLLAWEECILV